ncbi:MAG: Txe/YoeB family addiction module toxin [Bacteroidales bacterium]|jgi:toxin YoeB|nr:Txe/YoeB family addiction module toxin [Bacteroidales bacterium]
MEVVLMPTALEDIEFWKKSGNVQIQERISMLLEAISSHPFEGIGMPEKLKYELNGYWSRRIDAEHRVVYAVINNNIYVISCLYHYK